MTLVGAEELPRLSAEGRPWWRDPFRVFQTNLREVDAALDVERTLDAIEDHGANVWLINGGGILSFYPTALPFQTRNPYLDARPSADLLGDAVSAAHSRGLRVVARMDFSKVAASVAERYPDWLYVDPAGDYQVYQGLTSTCPAAGYYQEAAFEVLAEVAERYPVDGFFFNWFGFNEVDYSGRYRGVSQNAASRARYAEWSGGANVPTGPESEGYLDWQRWSAAVIGDLTERFRSHISDLLPGAAFIRGLGSDVIFHEANNEIGRTLWPSVTAEAVSAIKTARPDQPVFVNSVAFVDMPYRLAAEEPAHYEQYIAQTIARGGNPSVYILGTPGSIDYPNVSAVAPLFRFHRDNSDAYTDAVPAAEVALVRPDPLRLGAEMHELARQEFRGAYRALQQRHVPFDVLRQADLAQDDLLARYKVVVLPDCGALGDAAVVALDHAVEAGLTVVLTGSSGVDAPRLAASPVAAYGDLQVDREVYAVYAADKADADGHPRHPVVPVYGHYRPIEVAAHAQRGLRLVPSAPYGPPEKAYGNRITEEPATAVSRVPGGGGVVVIPWTIGRSFRDLGLTVSRDLLVDLVEAPLQRDLSFDLPAHVEITLLHSGNDMLVHLLNLSGVQGNGFAAPLPVRGATLRTTGPVRATDLRARESLALEPTDDGGCLIRLPVIDALGVIRIERDLARPGKEAS
jgi:hypothetical protein